MDADGGGCATGIVQEHDEGDMTARCLTNEKVSLRELLDRILMRPAGRDQLDSYVPHSGCLSQSSCESYGTCAFPQNLVKCRMIARIAPCSLRRRVYE
jgi:hypothetical protein